MIKYSRIADHQDSKTSVETWNFKRKILDPETNTYYVINPLPIGSSNAKPKRDEEATPEVLKEVKRMYEAGVTIAKIAAKFDCSNIGRLFDLAGVVRNRGQGRYRKGSKR